jgi:hypothetical protein
MYDPEHKPDEAEAQREIQQLINVFVHLTGLGFVLTALCLSAS